MSGQRHLSDEDREHFERQLAQHYGVPVRPVDEYCAALRSWVDALGEKVKREDAGEDGGDSRDEGLRAAYEHMSHPSVQLAIFKSACLGRMIYGGEPLRTQMCPEHKGHWQGLSWEEDGGCPHGCHLTGWLPNRPTTIDPPQTDPLGEAP